MGEKTIVSNRRARREYHVLDNIEAGIVLQGTEVKTLRTTNSMTLKDSYADIIGGELYLVGAHIAPYEFGNVMNHEPERPRKLLLHKREIVKLAQRVAEKGLTLIPRSVYFKQGMVKVDIGLCRGKHSYDKREAIKERETKRDMDRAMKETKYG
jgi:SsrA-binding protein